MKSPLPDLSGAVVMLADPGSLAMIDSVLAHQPAEVVAPDWVLVVADFKGETVRGIQTATWRNYSLAVDAWILGGKSEACRPGDFQMTAATAAVEALYAAEQQLAGRRLVVLVSSDCLQRLLRGSARTDGVEVLLVGDTDTWGRELLKRKGTAPLGILDDDCDHMPVESHLLDLQRILREVMFCLAWPHRTHHVLVRLSVALQCFEDALASAPSVADGIDLDRLWQLARLDIIGLGMPAPPDACPWPNLVEALASGKAAREASDL